MPVLALAPAAATAFWGAVGAGAVATSSLVAGKMQANAAKDATNAQVTASNHAADVQAKAAADTLAFQREQAAYDAQTAETNRHANYDQDAARQSRLGTVGEAFGLPARQTPAYVPLPPSPFGTVGHSVGGPMVPPQGIPSGVQGPSGSPTPNGAPPPTSGPSSAYDPRIQALVQPLVSGLSPTSQSIDQVIAGLQKAGVQAQRATHANGTLQSDDKLLFGDGTTLDLIGDVGSANAKWIFNPDGRPGSGTTGSPTPRQSTTPTSSPFGTLASVFGQMQAPAGVLQMPKVQYGQPVSAYFQ